MDKIKRFVTEHPQWTSWIVLAIGMVAILVWSARDVGLLPGQWAALIIATILVAGLAVWIIGWEDEEDASAEDVSAEDVSAEGVSAEDGDDEEPVKDAAAEPSESEA